MQYTLGHSHGYFTDCFSGSLLSKVSNVAGAINELIPEILWTHINASVSLLVTIVFLFVVDPTAAGVFALLLVVLVIYNRSLAAKKAAYSKDASQSSTDLRAQIVDVITNVQAVRQYVRVTDEQENIETFSEKSRRAHFRNWMFT